jgi:hypothetical protein
MDILYYSNYCKHSQMIIQSLSKTDIRDKISFICIDKRSRDQKNNQIYIELENGTKVIMPPNVHSVPALLLVKENYHVLYGTEIMPYFKPHIENKNNEATRNNGEPMAFALSGSNGGMNIVSEQYTFYSMTPEELSSKGKGGMRQMHNYVSAKEETLFIPTPPDTYKPDKIGDNITVDLLENQRMDEFKGVSLPGPTSAI